MNSPRYILLAITSATMIAAAMLARFFPDLLSLAGAELRSVLTVNWVYVLVAGLALGGLNAYLTFARKSVRAE